MERPESDSPIEPQPNELPAAPAPSDALVDAWFAKHFHNLGAQLDTTLHNILYAAKEELKALLLEASRS